MGNLQMDLGDYQQAKEYYESALSIRLNKLGAVFTSLVRTITLVIYITTWLTTKRPRSIMNVTSP